MKKRIIALSLTFALLISFYQSQKAEAIIFVVPAVAVAIGELAISAGATWYAVDHMDKFVNMVKDEVLNLSGKSVDDLNGLFDGSMSVTVTDWLCKGVDSVLGKLKSDPIVTDAQVVPANYVYQKWVGYPDSPCKLADFPYEIMFKNLSDRYCLFVSTTPFKAYPDGNYVPIKTSALGQIYLYDGTNWIADAQAYSYTEYAWQTFIKQANHNVMNTSNNSVYYAKNTSDTMTQNVTYNYTTYVTNAPAKPAVQVQAGSKLVIPATTTKDTLINQQTIEGTGAKVYTDTSVATNTKSILDEILDLPGTITNSITDFFTVDWALVSQAMDFTPIWQSHFPAFYTLTDTLKNISETPLNGGGKFSMKIPKQMGGDDKEHVVLDYTVGQSAYIDWARTILKWIMWCALGIWIMKKFEPKISIN